MSRSLAFRVLIVLAVLAGGAFAAVQMLRPTIVVEKVRRAIASDAAPCTLTVLAERTPVVTSEVGGRIARSALEIGRHVAAGEVLVEIDPTELQLEIEQNKNDIAATKQKLAQGSALRFSLESERESLANKQELLAKGGIERIAVDRQKSVVAQLEFNIAAEKTQLEQQLAYQENGLKLRENRLAKMTVVAPIDGVITHVYVGAGDQINGGQPIADMISNKRLVEARVSEENIKGVTVGKRAFVRFLPYGAAFFEGRVTQVLPAADPQTQRYVALLEVDIPMDQLIPGMTGEASIERSRRENALVIPPAALVGRRVFAVRNGRVELREIETGLTSVSAVEVTKGLREGDMVAVDGLDSLRNGDKVKVVEFGKGPAGGVRTNP